MTVPSWIPRTSAVSLELDAEVAERVVEPRLDRPELDAEHLGRLLKGQPMEVVEDNHALVFFGQGCDPLADDLPQLRLLGPLRGKRPVVRHAVFRGLIDRARVEPAPRQARVAEVERDAVQPGQRRDVRMERMPALIGAGERVLEDLLGNLTIAGQAIGRPVDGGAIASEKLLEGVQIISLDAAQQLRIQCLTCPRRGASRSVGRRRLVSMQAIRPRGPSIDYKIRRRCGKGSVPVHAQSGQGISAPAIGRQRRFGWRAAVASSSRPTGAV